VAREIVIKGRNLNILGIPCHLLSCEKLHMLKQILRSAPTQKTTRVLRDRERDVNVQHHTHFLTKNEADTLLAELKTLDKYNLMADHDGGQLKQRVLRFYGKEVVTPRQTAAFGDPGTSYRFSGQRQRAAPWPPFLLELKQQVAEFLGEEKPFNFVLINEYKDGSQTIGWHADDERDIEPGSVIASLSVGDERDFRLRPKDPSERHGRSTTTSVRLRHGDLLAMHGNTQKHYEHSVPRTKKHRKPRYNLTFRHMNVPPPKTRKRKRSPEPIDPLPTAKKPRHSKDILMY